MLNVEPALFTLAIHRVGKDAKQLWMIIKNTVSKNVWICRQLSRIVLRDRPT